MGKEDTEGGKERNRERGPEVKDKAMYGHVDVDINRTVIRKHYSFY